MKDRFKPSRRSILKSGMASAAALTIHVPILSAAPRPKKPGETKVVYLGGDQLHNGYGQEDYLRRTFRDVDWRFFYITDARYVTPEFISDADLLMMLRWLGPIPVWSPEPIVEHRNERDGFMSDELAEAIIDNVANRGMGFVGLHATVTCAGKPGMDKLMGVTSIMHGPFQKVRLHSLNPNHPITNNIRQWKQIDGKGWWDRELTDTQVIDFEMYDENFGAAIVDPRATVLLKSTGLTDNRTDNAGWCVEQGNGRVVGLLAGHSSDQFIDPSNRQLQFRAAHWAMHRDIPEYTGALDHR